MKKGERKTKLVEVEEERQGRQGLSRRIVYIAQGRG